MTSHNDDFFMDIALAEAAKAAEAGEVPIGAVAVDPDGNIIARAHNLVEKENSVSRHAEFEVVRQIENMRHDWRMTGITIYVTKEPCPMCAGMLVNSRISRIVYGLPDPAFGGCGGAVDIPGMPGALWHPEVTGNVKSNESKELVQNFFRRRREAKTKNI